MTIDKRQQELQQQEDERQKDLAEFNYELLLAYIQRQMLVLGSDEISEGKKGTDLDTCWAIHTVT